MTKQVNDMTRAERAQFFAGAPRATAGTMDALEDGDFKRWWVGKLRGRIVSDPDGNGYKHESKQAALDCARSFREHAKAEVKLMEARDGRGGGDD